MRNITPMIPLSPIPPICRPAESAAVLGHIKALL